MKKKEGWPELMNAHIRAVRKQPFVAGKFDCCLFAADCVQAMTGEDPAADFRGKYSTMEGAIAALKEFSGGGLLETMLLLAERFGWEKIDHRYKAQRGDIVMGNPKVLVGDYDMDGSMGICCGPICVFVGDQDLKAVSTIENKGAEPTILHVWHIPVARD